jgi:hypothetical protein
MRWKIGSVVPVFLEEEEAAVVADMTVKGKLNSIREQHHLRIESIPSFVSVL